ncbi:MAG TPA: hypothetical protein VGL61_26035 [Kofleriaceae bacterium]|jgi:hypothetical protein
MRRPLVYAGVGLVALVILAVAFSRPGGKDAASSAQGSGSATLGDAPPVTAVDLDAAYRANEVRADSLYRSKLVHVTGVVDKIAKDIADRAVVTLRTDGTKGITCTFAAADPLLLELDRESRVTMHCTGNGFAFHGVMLDDCHVDAAHGPPCEVWDNAGQAVHGECTRNCTGVVYRGYCDGPSDVVCCAASAPVSPVAVPKPSVPGRLEQAAGSN